MHERIQNLRATRRRHGLRFDHAQLTGVELYQGE